MEVPGQFILVTDTLGRVLPVAGEDPIGAFGGPTPPVSDVMADILGFLANNLVQAVL